VTDFLKGIEEFVHCIRTPMGMFNIKWDVLVNAYMFPEVIHNKF
jgi:hypothetical protein